MTIHKVLRLGDPRLREVSSPVETFDTEELHALVDDMRETMDAYDGAGLAAPQIGVLQRVMIFGIESNPRYPEAEVVPMTVLINPDYEVIDETPEAGWEGCLSVPGMRGVVARPGHIRYRGYDQFGMLIEREVEGFHARVFQHEFDHLNGILYPDRIEDLSQFGFTEELDAAADAANAADRSSLESGEAS